jgi:hypothetical protein
MPPPLTFAGVHLIGINAETAAKVLVDLRRDRRDRHRPAGAAPDRLRHRPPAHPRPPRLQDQRGRDLTAFAGYLVIMRGRSESAPASSPAASSRSPTTSGSRRADRTRAEKILLDAVAIPRSAGLLARLTDNWLEMTVRFVVPGHGIRNIKDQITRAVLRDLDGAGIGIAVPPWK